MSFDGLHETVIRDIMDVVRDGIDTAEGVGFTVGRSGKLYSASSLSKATEGLILVFPHLCSMNVSPETAQMLTKAIETKAVSLLQIAFSAFNITNSADAVDYVRQFHTNIGSGRMSVDKFIDAMDSITNESTNSLNGVNRNLVKTALEEFKQMECYFEEDLSESTINDFKVVSRYGNYVITEAEKGGKGKPNNPTPTSGNNNGANGNNSGNDDEEKKKYRATRDAIDDMKDIANLSLKADELDLKRQADANNAAKDNFDMLRQQLLPSDIKKANEMVPSMMIVNFVTRDEELQASIRSQAVIGVKAKLYPASSDDIINKIIIKNADNNVFLKLLRVSTRELNFVKDFLLAIDDAKLAAVSCSTKGSDTNRFLKVLERRALKGKVRRALNMNNSYKAITTLTITKDEADFINRYNNIDVFNIGMIRKIMESLNIMMFIVADDNEECAHFIMDSGEDMFEKLSYTHLERESADGSYKKAINLMTKVVR